MTEKEYNTAPGVRRSALWKLTKSPAHFKWELEHPPEPTPALIFGAAAHCAVLTPELFTEQYAVIDCDLRTKEGKAAKQAALEAGKILLSKDDFERINGIVQSVKSNPYVMRLLNGPHETPYFWTDDITGEPCKCRTDAETDIGGQHYIVDLKTCMDASTDACMWEAIKHGYFMQAAMYIEGVKACTGKDSEFVFIFVEKQPPYVLNYIQCERSHILFGLEGDKYGRTKGYRELLGLYHLYHTENVFPGYNGIDGSVNTFSLPAWAKDENEE